MIDGVAVFQRLEVPVCFPADSPGLILAKNLRRYALLIDFVGFLTIASAFLYSIILSRLISAMKSLSF